MRYILLLTLLGSLCAGLSYGQKAPTHAELAKTYAQKLCDCEQMIVTKPFAAYSECQQALDAYRKQHIPSSLLDASVPESAPFLKELHTHFDACWRSKIATPLQQQLLDQLPKDIAAVRGIHCKCMELDKAGDNLALGECLDNLRKQEGYLQNKYVPLTAHYFHLEIQEEITAATQCK